MTKNEQKMYDARSNLYGAAIAYASRIDTQGIPYASAMSIAHRLESAAMEFCKTKEETLRLQMDEEEIEVLRAGRVPNYQKAIEFGGKKYIYPNHIPAIKCVRDRLKITLFEAKDVVDRYIAEIDNE